MPSSIVPGSILEGILGQLPAHTAGGVAAPLGESEETVRTAMADGAARILGGLSDASEKSAGFWQGILNLINDPANAGEAPIATLAAGTPTPEQSELGSHLLSSVFGGQQASVAAAITREVGLQPGSADRILNFVAPLILAWLNQLVYAKRLTASTLARALAIDTPEVTGFAPPAAPAAFKGVLPLWPILGVIFLAGLVLILVTWKPAGPSMAMASTAPPVVTADSKLGQFLQKKLPTGTELNIPEFGIENKLLQFIEDPDKKADKTTWFDFDRLLFDTGKATLQPSFQEQLQNIANILKAFPKVKVKIGGYTDNVGDKTSNLALSNDRASNVRKELVGLGVAENRLESEGYGEDHPVADNATEEGRAQNRRISLRVTEK